MYVTFFSVFFSFPLAKINCYTLFLCHFEYKFAVNGAQLYGANLEFIDKRISNKSLK